MGRSHTISTPALQRAGALNIHGGVTHHIVPLSLVSVLITVGVSPFVQERNRGEEGKTMPNFPFSTALTANQLGANPLAGWQYEWTPYPCSIIVLIRSTGTSTRLTLFSASETIQERTPIQGGGTAGVTPSELNTPAISFLAPGGDRIKIVIDEVGGLTPTIDGVVIINPI